MPVADLPVARHLPRTQRQNLAGQSLDAYPRQDQKSAVVHDPTGGCVAAARRSSRSTRPEPASSRPARSRADRPTPARDGAPSSAGSRRTARDIPDSDTVPSARATGGSPLGLPPRASSRGSHSLAAHATGAGSEHAPDTSARRGPLPPNFRRSGSCRNPSAWSRSSSCRHSWFFNPPLGRFHSSNSQTVRAISVTPRAENSRAIWRINSSSPARNVRPQKVRDSGMRCGEWRGSVRAGHNVQDHGAAAHATAPRSA